MTLHGLTFTSCGRGATYTGSPTAGVSIYSGQDTEIADCSFQDSIGTALRCSTVLLTLPVVALSQTTQLDSMVEDSMHGTVLLTLLAVALSRTTQLDSMVEDSMHGTVLLTLLAVALS